MPLRLNLSSLWNSPVPLRQKAFTIKREGLPTRGLAAFAILLLFCALPYAALGQSGPSGELRFLRHSRSMSSMPMMPSLFPLFIEDGSISSRLTLVNASALQTYATLTVRDEAGQAWQSQRITLAPHAQVQLEVATLLSGMGLQLASGSIVLNQGPSPMSQSIVGQLTLYSASSPVSYAEEEEFMPAMMPSTLLLSVAEASNQSPMVAITSTSSADQHATVQCTRNGAKSTHHITLPPNGQSIIEPCDASVAANSGEDAGPGYPAAISITTDGPAGEFSAFGLSRHRDPSSGAKYLGALQFFDPASLNSSSLVFSGIGSGRSLTPQNASTYTSQLAIANFGDTASNVDVEVYRASGANQITPVSKKLRVPAGSVVQLHLGTLMASPQDVASVVVSTTSSPGKVLAKLISTGDSAPYQLEQLAKDALDEHNGGIHPWSLENGSLSDLLLFNHSDSSQAFNVVIEAPGGVEWVKRVTIASHHTIDLSIEDLIAAKVTDDRGKLLPSSATHGTIIWSTASGVGTGRMLIRNSAEFAAQSFSCGEVYVICGGFLDGPAAVKVDDEGTFYASAEYCVNYNSGSTCDGDDAYSEYFQGGTIWSSRNDNIATVLGNGGQASVTGVAPGTATIDAEMFDTGCSADAVGDVEVVPTATLSINFTGSKSAGDKLNFSDDPETCSESLGSTNCSSHWRWNFEGNAVTSSDASHWTVNQTAVSSRYKGYTKDSSGTLYPFDNSTTTSSPDGPEFEFLQQPSGAYAIYWIDSPGPSKVIDGRSTDSVTSVQNFSVSICSTDVSGVCYSATWYIKIVVDPGGVLDSTKSTAGLGSASLNF